ncbi:MAG: uroporphyrinogen decarboxylase family protein [Anaerolineae bacterium]|nr:uroporphyrinogen decarboxylase family protein [Anaerolineae bacterium]
MNSYQRYTARLQGAAVDRAPNFNIMMRRAAHHIGQPLSRYYLDYRVLVEANLAVVADFHIDILQAISDPYREAADLGLEVEFPEDNLPLARQPLLIEPTDLSRLRFVAPEAGRRMSDRLEAIRLFRERAGGEVPIMGWVEGALAEAADLRGVVQLMTDLYDRPEWVLELLEFCVEQEIAFARAQVAAGADIIGLGDSICSQISPRMYRQFGLPYEQRIFAAVREMGAVGRLHICGNTSSIMADMARSGAQIVDLDWMVDWGQAVKTLATHEVAACGNFDPVKVMLQGTPEEVRQAVLTCVSAGDARSFIMAGCEIPDGTPAANLLAQYHALCEAGGS